MDAQLVFEDITPKQAQVYLGLNIENNRNPINEKVVRMSRDMKNGDWLATADPIKFNSEGRLIDGQHRLRAVMMSGTTQRFLVARDLPEDAVYVIDTGTTRSAGQALKIAAPDTKNISTLVAAAQVVHGYDNGVYRDAGTNLQNKDRMTNAEVLRYIEAHSEELDRATRATKNLQRSLPLPPASIAAAHVILSRVHAEQASVFFEAIRNGSGGFQSGDPIATLVRRAFNDRMDHRQVTPALVLFYIIRTWNAWRSDQALSKLQTASEGGHTAIPTPR